MKIKRYEAPTEQEAMERIRDELGPEAIVLSIRKTQPRGLFSLFRKPSAEVTAAYDEKFSERVETVRRAAATGVTPRPERIDRRGSEPVINAYVGEEVIKRTELAEQTERRSPALTNAHAAELMNKNKKIIEQDEMIRNLERRLKSNEDLLSKMVTQMNSAKGSPEGRRYDSNVIQLFYETLIEQGVIPEVAAKMLEDADSIEDSEKLDISLVTKVVYNAIINTLGESSPIVVQDEELKNNTVFFLGPTGVGKTTTIAKLSSTFILNDGLRVGLITADTYRIAAVEQLKTYGEILGIDVCVVYRSEDLSSNLARLRKTEDLILIDTAGRSHKSQESLDELKQILDSVPDSRRFLVLSVTTKYEDLVNISTIYSELTDFDLIFTKLDETTSLGCILNICSLTGKKMSYVAYGQSVPDDIEIVQSDKIAKSLLGFGGGLY